MEAEQTVDKAVKVLTATIASSGTTSGAVNLFGCTAVSFEVPSSFTGTSITFEASIDGGVTFKQLRSQDGTAVTYIVATDGIYTLSANTFAGVDQLKFVADAQGAERVIKLKPFII